MTGESDRTRETKRGGNYKDDEGKNIETRTEYQVTIAQ